MLSCIDRAFSSVGSMVVVLLISLILICLRLELN